MNILKAKKTMQDQGIPDEIIAQFNVPDLKGNLPEPRILFVEQMKLEIGFILFKFF